MGRDKQITYSRALTELEEIIAGIESEDVDIDTIAEKVKRAAYLINICREKLRNTDEEVKKILSEIEEAPDLKAFPGDDSGSTPD